MRNYQQFDIDGQWADPVTPQAAEVICPASEEVSGTISLGSEADVDKAAARTAFAVARRLRSGAVWVNRGFDFPAPFRGCKRSGNGREWGEHGFAEYPEVKAIIG